MADYLTHVADQFPQLKP